MERQTETEAGKLRDRQTETEAGKCRERNRGR